MANMNQRTAFEQQLCQQLLSFSEVTEALAERVLDLEQRLSGFEQRLDQPTQESPLEEGVADLLSESESRVSKLKDLLKGADVIPLERPEPEAVEPTRADSDEMDGEDGEDGDQETEYVDDPQIDLLSA